MRDSSDYRLLDFLYTDHERVASFLGQLNDEGVLRETQDGAVRANSSKKRGNLGPSMASFVAESDVQNSREVRQTYDPLWVNSRKLIAYFEKRKTDHRHRLGQAKIISGKLLAYDFSSLSHMMNSDDMIDFIAGGIKDGGDHANRSGKVKNEIKRKEASVAREMLKGMPLGIGFVLFTEGGHFWFNVKKKYLSLYELDIPLKFPICVSGEWSALGVIDALPDDHTSGLQSLADQKIDGMLPPMVYHMMQLIGAQTSMFGRPLQAHGFSPLIVFRQVTN